MGMSFMWIGPGDAPVAPLEVGGEGDGGLVALGADVAMVIEAGEGDGEGEGAGAPAGRTPPRGRDPEEVERDAARSLTERREDLSPAVETTTCEPPVLGVRDEPRRSSGGVGKGLWPPFVGGGGFRWVGVAIYNCAL